MESFPELFGLSKPLENEQIKSLMRVLCSKTYESNVTPFLDQLKEESDWCYDCNEVYPNLFISDAEAARDKEYLKAVGITHVLNTAEGDRMVNTNADYYKGCGIKYLGLQLLDLPITPIFRYFHKTADFIDEGMNSGGKVLVHCLMGISRSSTCALAYLMIKKKLSVQEAVQQIKNYREIRPNNGFLHQLIELDRQLQSST